jgi:c-di-GMP-binding flagellar brake protein YcgR
MMMTQDDTNRRRHMRINHSQIVSYTHYTKEEEIDRAGGIGTTSDISLGGVLIRIADEFSLGTRIELEISMGDELIFAQGAIVRVTKVSDGLYDVGVMFIDISSEDTRRLKGFFTERNIPM